MFFSGIDLFLRNYGVTITTQYAGGCSIIWMFSELTQEPSFVMTLTGSQKNPVLVIETGTFHRIVIKRN